MEDRRRKVDAIALSMARLGSGDVALTTAAVAVAIAVVANSAAKVGLAFVVGRSGFAWRLAAVLLSAGAVGFVAFVLMAVVPA